MWPFLKPTSDSQTLQWYESVPLFFVFSLIHYEPILVTNNWKSLTKMSVLFFFFGFLVYFLLFYQISFSALLRPLEFSAANLLKN